MVTTRSQSRRDAERKMKSPCSVPRLAGSRRRACPKLIPVGPVKVAVVSVATTTTTATTTNTTSTTTTTTTNTNNTSASASAAPATTTTTTTTSAIATTAHTTATTTTRTTTETTGEYRTASGNRVIRTIEDTSDDSVAPVIVQGPSSVMTTTPAERKITSHVTARGSRGQPVKLKVTHRQNIEVRRWTPNSGLSSTAPTLVFRSVRRGVTV